MMKWKTTLMVSLAAGLLATSAGAQSSTPPAGGKTIASAVGVYVFPTQGQPADQQSKDEAECYQWAVQNTGSDPFELTKQAEQQKQQAEQARQQASQAGKGSGAKGAAGGAAAGALVGAIAGDAGKGAAYGAGAGVLLGHHKGKEAEKKGTEQSASQSQKAEKATAEQIEAFKKAFSVCLEGHSYMVKY
jgi:hypothetical protein